METALKAPVDDKAIKLIGDEKLEEANREAVGAMTKPNAKAMKIIGDTHALSADSKARKRLGSIMSQEQINAAQLAQDKEEKVAEKLAKEAEKKREKEVEQILSENKNVPSKLEHAVTEKTLLLMGADEELKKNRDALVQWQQAIPTQKHSN